MGYKILPAEQAVKTENATYGVDFKFNTPGVFKSMTTKHKQIRANLKNLLLTQLGERVMQPTFGCRLLEVIFEPNHEDLKPFIQQSIFDAVQKWMPYISINVDIVTASDDPSLVDSIRVTVNASYNDLDLTPITVFASESGVSVSDTNI